MLAIKIWDFGRRPKKLSQGRNDMEFRTVLEFRWVYVKRNETLVN